MTEQNHTRTEKAHPKRKKWPLFLILGLLLLAAGVLGALWFWQLGPFAPAPPPAAYHAEGEVKALRLPQPQGAASEESLREYFSGALDFAAENGYNTLLFEAKTGLPVWWRDKTFPAAPEVSSGDSFFHKLDPLALLCEEAEGRNVQIWLLADPYQATGAEEKAKGKAAKYALETGESYFSPEDETYREMLAESLSALPQKYPIAGIALSGFSVSAQNPVSDTAAWQAGFSAFVTQLGEGLSHYETPPALLVDFDENSTLIDPAYGAHLLQNGVRYLLPACTGTLADAEKLAAYGQQPGSLILAAAPEQDKTALALFTAARQPYYAGAQLGVWPKAGAQAAQLGFLGSALTRVNAPLPEGFAIPHTLQVNYPAATDSIGYNWEQVYVMGNSDPAQPLLLNGVEVSSRGAEGSFGVLVPLAVGANTFTFSQGKMVVEHVITRPEPAPPPEEPPEETPEDDPAAEEPEEEPAKPAMPSDGTQEAQPGQAVQVVTVFAGGLTTPGKDSAINETYYEGAVAVVQESVRTVRWDSATAQNVLSWDYLLTNGDYLSARNCVWLETDGQAAFTGLAAQPDEDKNGEWLVFEGSGTPAAIISCEENRLSVAMSNTSFTLPGPFQSGLVKAATVETTETGVVLHLDVQNLWGYQIDYTDGATRLFLKRAPQRGADPAKPLAGVRVMLDAGHGADDIGAPGIMGAQGPNEKDLNLAQAQAIRYRLMQLGAEVIMPREDTDTFFTTHERLAQLMEEKPDFFLSVHHNSAVMTADQSGTAGLQDFYYIPQSYTAPLSQNFAAQLMENVAGASGRKASEPAWGYFNVLRTPVCPAVLFEYAFVISPADFESAASAEGLYAAACGTADGILASLPPAG